MKWNEVGTRIEQIMNQSGLTLAGFGVLIGKNKPAGKKISHVTIRNWISGSEIKKENWDALVKAMIKIDPTKSEEWLKTGKEQTKTQEPTGKYTLSDKEIISLQSQNLAYSGHYQYLIEAEEKNLLDPTEKAILEAINLKYKDKD